MKNNETLKGMENINNLFELADYLNDWQPTDPEEDPTMLTAAYAEDNPECYYIDDSEWDYLTDGEWVLYAREDGKFDTYSLGESYTPSDAAIAGRIKGGCVFTSNADPAHTFDFPAMLSAILYKMDKVEVRTLSPNDDNYREAADKLGLSEEYADDIYEVDDILFAVA